MPRFFFSPLVCVCWCRPLTFFNTGTLWSEKPLYSTNAKLQQELAASVPEEMHRLREENGALRAELAVLRAENEQLRRERDTSMRQLKSMYQRVRQVVVDTKVRVLIGICAMTTTTRLARRKPASV